MRNKILLISAYQEERILLEQILEELVNEGGELFIAERAEVGLELIRREKPALVILDSAMAESHGRELFRKVNEGGKMRKIHFLAITAKKEQEIEGIECIPKPIKPHPILEACRRYLQIPSSPVPEIPPM